MIPTIGNVTPFAWIFAALAIGTLETLAILTVLRRRPVVIPRPWGGYYVVACVLVAAVAARVLG